jgi:hypothetical protein
VAYSILIPAGTVAVNDMLELRVLCSYVASTNNKIVRTWISSANETVGAAVSGSATQITQLTVNSATLNALGHDRRFGVRSLTSLISYAFNAETSSDAGTNVVTVSARTVPTFASNTYFIVTVNRANGGDTMVLQHAGLIVHKN